MNPKMNKNDTERFVIPHHLPISAVSSFVTVLLSSRFVCSTALWCDVVLYHMTHMTLLFAQEEQHGVVMAEMRACAVAALQSHLLPGIEALSGATLAHPGHAPAIPPLRVSTAGHGTTTTRTH